MEDDASMTGMKATHILDSDSSPEFTLAEVLELEKSYRKRGKESQEQYLCEELATKFSYSIHRKGKSAIKWDQVQNWFQDRHICSSIKVPSSMDGLKANGASSDATTKEHPDICSSPISLQNLVILSKAWAAAERTKKPKAERVTELSDLTFEALSSKDGAWYDVAAFLNFRVLYSGELEVRVRFSGFSHDQDEWVNVRHGLRERSIPLEPSECHKVNVGDLVLCFRANEDHALYSDAHVVKIQRQKHGGENCTCIFVVRFEYDDSEEQLHYKDICCRPS